MNSPGGDGLASDVILREVNLLKEEKPIVVSMDLPRLTAAIDAPLPR